LLFDLTLRVEGHYALFVDHVLATAILDRLLHYSTTLNIKGDSYRLKEKRKAGLLGRAKPAEEAHTA